MRIINVSSSTLGLAEKRSLMSCVDRNWLTMGNMVRQFEKEFSAYCGARYGLATNNGTTALHLALIGLGIKPGDEVIIPALTYVATANAVLYVGAKPVLCDVEEDTLCINPQEVIKKITSKTKAIIVVHLYGHPCDMHAINEIAKKYELFVVEDAAEAHGAEVNRSRVGCLGDIGVFSFYGNKIITTGEGGMCITNSSRLCNRIKLYRGQGMDSSRRYWHPVVGYNYRMTDMQAAVGCSQMTRIDKILDIRRKLALEYEKYLNLANVVLPVERSGYRNAYWLYTIQMQDLKRKQRDNLMDLLLKCGVETRPVFYPIYQLPPYHEYGSDKSFPVSCRASESGISLPLHGNMSKQDVAIVCRVFINIITSRR